MPHPPRALGSVTGRGTPTGTATARVLAFVGGLVRLWRRGNRARRYAKQMASPETPPRPGLTPEDGSDRAHAPALPPVPGRSEDRPADRP